MPEANILGTIFDQRYEILEPLGAGGLATVYKARQLEIDRIVAIKLLHARFSADKEFKTRFLREAQTLNKLSHPNIVSIYHLGCSNDDTLYIVMELVEGQSLAQQLNAVDRLPTIEALEHLRTIAGALSYIHKNGIVHRDLKPSNIIMCKNGEQTVPKLIDFGLSKVNFETQRLTRTGELIGTPDYMSPEQCRGQHVNFSSDIYSLTVCIFEAITGRKPFDADTPVGIIFKHMNEAVSVLKAADVQQFHPELNRFLAQGMAKRPAERFKSMDEMIESLDDLIQVLKSIPTGQTSVSPGRNKWITCLVSSAVVLALGAVLAVSIMKQSDLNSSSKQHKVSQIKVTPLSVRLLMDYIGHTDEEPLNQLLALCRAYEQLSQRGSPTPRTTRLRTERIFAATLDENGLPATALRLCHEIQNEQTRLSISPSSADDMTAASECNTAIILSADILQTFGKKEKARKILLDLLTQKDLSPHNRASLYRQLIRIGEIDKIRQLAKSSEIPHDLSEISTYSQSYGYDDICIMCGLRQAQIVQPDNTDMAWGTALLNRAQAYMLLGKNELAHKDLLTVWSNIASLRRYQLEGFLDTVARRFASLGDYDKAIEVMNFRLRVNPTKSVGYTATQSEYMKMMEKQSEETVPTLMGTVVSDKKLSTQAKCELLFQAGMKFEPLRSFFSMLAYSLMNKAPEPAVGPPMRTYILLTVAANAAANNEGNLQVTCYQQVQDFIRKHGFMKHEDPNLIFGESEDLHAQIAELNSMALKIDQASARKRLLEILNKSPWQGQGDELMKAAFKFDCRDIAEKIVAETVTADHAVALARVCINHNYLKLARLCLDKAQQGKKQSLDPDIEIHCNILEAQYFIELNKPKEAKQFLKAIPPLHIERMKNPYYGKQLLNNYIVCMTVTKMDDQRRELSIALTKLKDFQTDPKWTIW